MSGARERRYGVVFDLWAAAAEDLQSIAEIQASNDLEEVVDVMRTDDVFVAAPIFRTIAEAYDGTERVSPDLKLDAFVNLAAVCYDRAPDEAKAMLEAALDFAPDEPRVLALAASLLFDAKDHAAVTAICTRMLAIEKTDENRKWLAYGHKYAGLVDHAAGRLAAASEHYQSAAEAFEAIGDRLSVADVLVPAGLVARREKRQDVAARCFSEALSIWRNAGLAAESVRTLGYLASVYFVRRDFVRAIDVFGERAELNRKLGDLPELAADYANRGLAFLNIGDMAAAENNWREAVELYRSLDRSDDALNVVKLMTRNGFEVA